MERKVYISDDILSLSEYLSSDDQDSYNNWQDIETQNGFNYKFTDSFEKYCNRKIKQRFYSTIIRLQDKACIGLIFVSPENCLPDLAIQIFKQYRRQDYGTRAFSLGVKYCFDVLKLDKIYAGCYIDNLGSLNMLEKCGFKPHPEGNQKERHYLTGKKTTQLDFVKLNPMVDFVI